MDGFGAVIRRYRRDAGMSQQALAQAVGKSVAAVTQWEREVNVPRRETAEAIDKALDAEGAVVRAVGYAPEDEMLEVGRSVGRIDGQLTVALRFITTHEERIAELERQLREMAATLRELAERVLLPDVDEVQHLDESRTAR